MLRYVIIKTVKIKDKDKERVLKTARKIQLVTYKETPIRLLLGFAGQRKRYDIYKVLKGKSFKPRILPYKFIFQNEGDTKCSPEKQKLKVFITTKALREILKGLL